MREGNQNQFRFQKAQQRRPQQANEVKGPNWMSLLPILMLAFPILFPMGPKAPEYSFTKTREYSYPNETFRLRIPFFTKINYANKTADEKYKLGLQIEEQYLNRLMEECANE